MNEPRAYGMVAAAGAFVAVSSALAVVPFHSADHPDSPAASCGSVFLPSETWADCIRDRNSTSAVTRMSLEGPQTERGPTSLPAR